MKLNYLYLYMNSIYYLMDLPKKTVGSYNFIIICFFCYTSGWDGT